MDQMAGELSRSQQQLKRQQDTLAVFIKELSEIEEWLKLTKDSISSKEHKTIKAQLAQKKVCWKGFFFAIMPSILVTYFYKELDEFDNTRFCGS